MFKCGYLSHGLYVSFGLDGNVLPCCFTSKLDSNLKREPTDDLLNGPLVKSFRQTAIKGDIPDICTDCVKLEKLTGRGPRLENIYFNDTTVKEIIAEEMYDIYKYVSLMFAILNAQYAVRPTVT